MTIKQRGKDKICTSAFTIEGRYYVFTFNGKRGQPLITSKREAREREVELKKRIRAGTFIEEAPAQNFSRFYDEVFMDYSRSHKSAKSTQFDEYYGQNLKAEFGQKKLIQITPRMIERFLLKLSQTDTRFDKPYSPVTVRMHFDRINQLFNQAIRERVINENPCRLVSPTVLKQFPSWRRRERWLGKYDPKEEEKLFRELDGKIQTICRLLLNTGLRPPKEVLGIQKAHINLTDEPRYYKHKGRDFIIPPHALFVAEAKDGRVRSIPLNKTAENILRVLCDDVTTGRWLFVNREGKPLGSIKKGWQRACERAEIDDLRPYDLRHTFATRLVERYVPTPVISALLGHSMAVAGFGPESRITPGYAHATWEAMQRAVERLEHPVPDLSIFQTNRDKIGTKQPLEEHQNEARKVG